MEKNNGGPAFPQTEASWQIQGLEGLTARDYIAIHAPHKEIESMIPSDVKGAADFLGIELDNYNGSYHYKDCLIKARYMYADSMLKERERSNESVS